jgi:hypothetical protein
LEDQLFVSASNQASKALTYQARVVVPRSITATLKHVFDGSFVGLTFFLATRNLERAYKSYPCSNASQVNGKNKIHQV